MVKMHRPGIFFSGSDVSVDYYLNFEWGRKCILDRKNDFHDVCEVMYIQDPFFYFPVEYARLNRSPNFRTTEQKNDPREDFFFRWDVIVFAEIFFDRDMDYESSKIKKSSQKCFACIFSPQTSHLILTLDVAAPEIKKQQKNFLPRFMYTPQNA